MKAATHLAFAGLTGVVAAGMGSNPGVAGGAALAFGSLLPDVDTTTSDLGRFVKPVARELEKRFGHRTITHSLLGMAILGAVTSPLLLVWPPVWTFLLVGVFSHIILDTCNIMGVKMFWPSPLWVWISHNRNHRVPYGSPKEFTWLAGISITAILLIPFSIDGFGPWFHRLILPNTTTGVADYLKWRNDFEIWADVRGFNIADHSEIDGRYRVVDAIGKDTMLVEDSQGNAYSVSQDDSANILSKSVRVYRGGPIVTSTYRVDLQGRLLSEWIESLPNAESVTINAVLELNTPVEIPHGIGYFERLSASGKTLELRAATPESLVPYGHYVIEAGAALVRAEYRPENANLANAERVSAVGTPTIKAHTLRIPDLPSVTGLVVAVGDRVEEGTLIARYVDDTVLDANAAEIEAAEARLADLETSVQLEREAHQSRAASITQEISDAQANVERLRYLVEADAEPRNKLVTAEAELRQARQRELTAQTSWTSRHQSLEAQMRQARLTIASSERSADATMEQQWVRAPVAGLVSDIRLVSVSTKGVDLDVMILEEVGGEQTPSESTNDEAEAPG